MKMNTHAISRSDFPTDFRAAQEPLGNPAMIRYQAIEEHLCCELNGEAVILSLKNGKYYGLNPVASRIWELIQTPLSISEIESAIMLEYEVEEIVCKEQVAAFLEHMAAEELVGMTDEKAKELF